MTKITVASYALAGVMFFALAVLAASDYRNRNWHARLLALSAIAGVAWSVANALQASASDVPAKAMFLAEVLRLSGWLVVLAHLVGNASKGAWYKIQQVAAYVLPLSILIAGFLVPDSANAIQEILAVGIILQCLLGLTLMESVFRRTEKDFRKSIGHLTIAIAMILGFDLALFTAELVSGQQIAGMRAVRGMANAIVVPFFVAVAREQRNWSLEMFISRQMAFFGFSLLGISSYVIITAVVVAYLHGLGTAPGMAAATILAVGGGLAVLTVLLSDDLRRKVKVLVSKHFFRNRYDYREEWRRLTQALYHAGVSESLSERSLEAVAGILNSRSAVLLTQGEDREKSLRQVKAWRREALSDVAEHVEGSLVQFLKKTHWVVDTYEYLERPELYSNLELPEWLKQSSYQQIIIPLLLESELVGILVLEQETPASLTFEDTDLLKIVGRQVAGLIAQEQTLEKLAEARQFRAYTRLTAFLMHDLKNLAAQQSLVVKNAAKFRTNPEFLDDAFETIALSAERTNRLITQLAERNRRELRQRVIVSEILKAAVTRTQDRQPAPVAVFSDNTSVVLADRDRMFSIFLHVLRNAQDACTPNDEINVEMSRIDQSVKIEISDTGVGMDENFIRESLFRPFESTKGVDGMGIGAYQVREYVLDLGGEVHVASLPGRGTTFTIMLPVVPE